MAAVVTTERSSLLMTMVIALLSFSPRSTISSPVDDHEYNVGDQIPLFANKIGPLDNPSETYKYFDLPFCQPGKMFKKKESIGDAINGDHLTNTRYNLKFREEKEELLCRKTFSKKEVAQLREAISRDFYFQMFYDDLPFWGFIGKVVPDNTAPNQEGHRYYLFSRLQFNALYSANNVIEMHALGDPSYAVDITENADIDVKFTYLVTWNATTLQFQNRMDRYSRASSLPPLQQLHRFSIFNSVTILLLVLGLFMLFHRSNIKNGMQSGDEEGGQEVGLNSDAFRSPPSMPLFCAVMGCGVQLLIFVCCLSVLATLGFLQPYAPGTLWTSVLVLYTLTSPFAGYTAASFHSQFAETTWMQSVILAGFLFAVPLSAVILFLTTLSRSFEFTTALPFSTILLLFLLYIIAVIPLLFVGGFFGHLFGCRILTISTRRSLREVMPSRWYNTTHGQMLLAGLLTFSAILVEYHQLLASFWSHKTYTTPGILFVNFFVLVVSTAILSAGLTYVQLCRNDHHCWWRSFLRGGSTAIFMFVYSLLYYGRSNMSGAVQFCFFLDHSACVCYAFFLMLGAISFSASLIFARQYYHSVKYE